MELYDSKRKVVLVRGDKSKLYEQAIFILHAGASQHQMDFVKEAERIINASYIADNAPPVPAPSPRRAKTTSRTDVMLNIALFATGIAIVALLFLNLL